MTTIFRNDHPEYARIEAQIHRARAERALIVGEAIGNGLMVITRAVQHAWRVLFQTRGERKAA